MTSTTHPAPPIQIHDFFSSQLFTTCVSPRTCGWEQILEIYYDCQVWKTVHVTLDY